MWNNLKNSWEEYDRVEGWFSRSNIDNIIGWILFLWITAVLFSMLVGCATMRHEPSCICDCNSTSSHFECSGIHYHEKLEIN
jgi:hypothetical protein